MSTNDPKATGVSEETIRSMVNLARSVERLSAQLHVPFYVAMEIYWRTLNAIQQTQRDPGISEASVGATTIDDQIMRRLVASASKLIQ